MGVSATVSFYTTWYRQGRRNVLPASCNMLIDPCPIITNKVVWSKSYTHSLVIVQVERVAENLLVERAARLFHRARYERDVQKPWCAENCMTLGRVSYFVDSAQVEMQLLSWSAFELHL